MSFTLENLTEGIRKRHLSSQNNQLIEKWSRTGLLRGLDGVKRENMARLMENQASQVLREASALSSGGGGLAASGDMRGFSNIAFPIVRRVFGGLIANDLVSVQPMSLPSGLLFYLDYTRGSNVGTGSVGSVGGTIYSTGSSLYNSPAGKAVREGSDEIGGQYDLLGTTYSRVHRRHNLAASEVLASGSHDSVGTITLRHGNKGAAFHLSLVATGSDARLFDYDAQLTETLAANDVLGSVTGSHAYTFVGIKTAGLSHLDATAIKGVALFGKQGGKGLNYQPKPVGTDSAGEKYQEGERLLNIRRLNKLGTFTAATGERGGAKDPGAKFVENPLADISAATTGILMVVSGAIDDTLLATAGSRVEVVYPLASQINSAENAADTLAVPAFESNFGSDPEPVIPEIDIKVEAVPVVAETRKLRAKWSPELAQDLNAYHSLDAEVELTQILSEQIALEIDREILNDLLTQAQAANFFWSRAPGKFVNKKTGVTEAGVSFTGTVREWYETLTETIIDVANQIHRKTLRGSANFIVVGPDVATILEASVYYKPSYSIDGDGQVSAPMTMGADVTGTLSNRFTVYKDPYFPRNKVLVGFKGGSYLESGYVYAPYVPLIVTPTIFQPEDFTPRKGVMTRYGKKMVRADFFGTVTCLDMNII